MSNMIKHESSGINILDKDQFENLQRVCNVFINSEIVPRMYRVSADNSKEKAIANCMIAVNMAQRMGADVLMVMQNMYQVHGVPGWSSKFLVSMVNGSGKFSPIRYKIEKIGTTIFNQTSMDNYQCIAFAKELSTGDILESAPVTVKMAIMEGWYGKKGSKWPTMTRLMLQYRSATFWTRAYAPELSMGMSTVDEIEDTSYIDVTDKVADKKHQMSNNNAPKEDLP